MMHKWALVILLARLTLREVLASFCNPRNCSQVILDEVKPKTFLCKAGFEKEFETFKSRKGVREIYEYSSADNVHEKPVIKSIKLDDYLKISHPEITRYNNEDLENITHGLTLEISIPGDREYRALYMEFGSSRDTENVVDNFYLRFPKKHFWEFSSSASVLIQGHLCLQGLQPHPVTYTLLLTFYPITMPHSSIYHISFSKDNLAVAVSLYPRENDIHVLFETASNFCEITACLCRKTPDRSECEDYVMLSSASYTFSDKSPGVYFVKIEQYCPGDYSSDEGTLSFFSQSPLIQIPGLNPFVTTPKENYTSNTPFVVIGCLLALVLLVVMYLAVRTKVSLFSSFFKRKSDQITSSVQANDTQLDTYQTSVPLCAVNSPSVDDRPINSGRCTSSLSVYTYRSGNEFTDDDQASVVIDEELRNYMREINHFQTYDDHCCPVHG